MKNLSEQDILTIVKDIQNTTRSVRDIIFAVKDIIQMFKMVSLNTRKNQH